VRREDDSPTPDAVAYAQVPGATLRGAPTDPVVTTPSGERYGLSSEVAVLVFQLCRRPATARTLAHRVVELYEVTPERAERDVTEFLEALAQVGALERVPLADGGQDSGAGHA
jgi:hypothetical protein